MGLYTPCFFLRVLASLPGARLRATGSALWRMQIMRYCDVLFLLVSLLPRMGRRTQYPHGLREGRSGLRLVLYVVVIG